MIDREEVERRMRAESYNVAPRKWTLDKHRAVRIALDLLRELAEAHHGRLLYPGEACPACKKPFAAGDFTRRPQGAEP